MATVPVPVKPSTPSPAATPDIWQSLRNEMDRLFDSFPGRFGAIPFMPTRLATPFIVPSPAVDITEKDNAFVVTAEIPGLTEKDIEVLLSGDTLTIKGEKKQETEEKKKNSYLSERRYGAFERSFQVPQDVDETGIEASFSQGLLTVTLPKSAEAQKSAKTIAVKAA